jgi:hypothetical protein
MNSEGMMKFGWVIAVRELGATPVVAGTVKELPAPIVLTTHVVLVMLTQFEEAACAFSVLIAVPS